MMLSVSRLFRLSLGHGRATAAFSTDSSIPDRIREILEFHHDIGNAKPARRWQEHVHYVGNNDLERGLVLLRSLSDQDWRVFDFPDLVNEPTILDDLDELLDDGDDVKEETVCLDDAEEEVYEEEEEVEEEPLEPSTAALLSLALSPEHTPDELLDLVQTMWKSLEPNSTDVEIALLVLSRRLKAPSLAQSIVRNNQDWSVPSVSAALQVCQQTGDVDRARELLSAVRPTCRAYTLYIQLLEDETEATRVLQECLQSEPPYDSRGVDLVVQAALRRFRTPSFLEGLLDLITMTPSYTPSPRVFTALAQAGKQDDALLRDLLALWFVVHPRAPLSDRMLRWALRVSTPDLAVDVALRAVDRPHVLKALQICVDAGALRPAQQIVDAVTDPILQRQAQQSLLKGCAAAGDTERARRVWKNMAEPGDEDCALVVSSFRDFRAAQEFLDSLDGVGDACYSALVGVAVQSKVDPGPLLDDYEFTPNGHAVYGLLLATKDPPLPCVRRILDENWSVRPETALLAVRRCLGVEELRELADIRPLLRSLHPQLAKALSTAEAEESRRPTRGLSQQEIVVRQQQAWRHVLEAILEHEASS